MLPPLDDQLPTNSGEAEDGQPEVLGAPSGLLASLGTIVVGLSSLLTLVATFLTWQTLTVTSGDSAASVVVTGWSATDGGAGNGPLIAVLVAAAVGFVVNAVAKGGSTTSKWAVVAIGLVILGIGLFEYGDVISTRNSIVAPVVSASGPGVPALLVGSFAMFVGGLLLPEKR